MKNLENIEIKLSLLLTQAQKGCSQSYSNFLIQVTPIVRRLVLKKIQYHDCEDVVQEILISIHKARHTFDGDRPIFPWIFSITKFRINDHLRQVYHKKEWEVYDSELVEMLQPSVHSMHSDDDNMPADFDLASQAYDVSNQMNHFNDSHQSDNVDVLFKQLSERDQKILSMMYMEEYSIKETANYLGMNESAVKVVAHRSIKKIKNWLGL